MSLNIDFLLLSFKGKRACVGYEDGTLKVWDLKKGTTVFHLTGKDGIYCYSSYSCDSIILFIT